MCCLPPVMCGVFDNLNGPAVTDTLDRHNHFTTKIWPLHSKQLLILPKFCLPLFSSFLRIEILELTAKKYAWTCLYLNVRNKCFMNVLVQLVYSLRQGFLTFFCAMDPFESLVKPVDPFSQKCI